MIRRAVELGGLLFFVVCIPCLITVGYMGGNDLQFWVEPHSTEQFLQALDSPMSEQVVCYDPDLNESEHATRQAIERLRRECPNATIIAVPARSKRFVSVYDPYAWISGGSGIGNLDIRVLRNLSEGIFEYDIVANLRRVQHTMSEGATLSKEGRGVAAASEIALLTKNSTQLRAYVPGVVETRGMVLESGGKTIDEFVRLEDDLERDDQPIQFVAHDPRNEYFHIGRQWSPVDVAEIAFEVFDLNVFSDEIRLLLSLTEMAEGQDASPTDIALEIMKWAAPKIASLVAFYFSGPAGAVVANRTVDLAITLVDGWLSGEEGIVPRGMERANNIGAAMASTSAFLEANPGNRLISTFSFEIPGGYCGECGREPSREERAALELSEALRTVASLDGHSRQYEHIFTMQRSARFITNSKTSLGITHRWFVRLFLP